MPSNGRSDARLREELSTLREELSALLREELSGERSSRKRPISGMVVVFAEDREHARLRPWR